MTTQEKVKQIHNEFFAASDQLKEKVKSIKAETIAKGERLKSLGFVNAQEVATSEVLKVTSEQIKHVDYYSFHYPHHKFITESQVESICRKYNLVFGEASMYKGTIPEGKLKEIEQFKLLQRDRLIITEKRLSKRWPWENTKAELWTVMLMLKLFGVCPNWLIPFGTVYSWRRKTEGFKICAPISDMNIDYTYRIFNSYKIEAFPDPVVLQPVKGGYLIVTAWGDEASDESVVNEKMN